MRVLIQRVKNASVTIDEKIFSSIEKGLLVFVGIESDDNADDIEWLTNKIVQLRVFDDENKVPNLSLIDIDGDLLLVSQFTLHANCKKGNRPSYIKAARLEIAIPIYDKMILSLENALKKKIATGKFGADMQVSLINDGPISIWIDSKNRDY